MPRRFCSFIVFLIKKWLRNLPCFVHQVEKRNSFVRARVEHLRQGMQDVSGMADALEKVQYLYLYFNLFSHPPTIHEIPKQQGKLRQKRKGKERKESFLEFVLISIW